MAVQSKSAISSKGYKNPRYIKRFFISFDLICLKDDRAFSLLHQEFPQILVPVVKIVKKNWGHRKNFGESEGQTFKGYDREKCLL